MKLLSLLFVATLLLVNSFQQSQEPAELQEARTLNESAVKLFNQGKYDEAMPLAKRALQIREKLLPRTDEQISSSLTNLGEIYLAQKDYKQAKEIFLRLLQIQEELFGGDDPNLSFTLDRLAVLYYVAGHYNETEEAYKRGLALREKSLGENDALVAQSWFALGEFYRFRRELKPSLESYKKALTIYAARGGIMTPDFERAADGIACLGYDHRKRELFEELRTLRRQLSGREAPRDPNEGGVMNGRALSLPQPEYPGAAAARRLRGTVIVKVDIDETGTVVNARDMCQGPPFLSEAAVAAAWKARFSPTSLDGVPVKVSGIIQYNFTSRFR
ncbi:MAG TPA: TonB family protein [Pyrinomonadaceae bacterium]|nr:TonB family protein [Pyrinomonadaceae bacterium]